MLRVGRFLRVLLGVSLPLGLGLVPAPAAHAAWEWATGPSLYDEEGGRRWGVDVTPYLWLASLNGEMRLPPTGGIPVDTTFPSLATNLDAGFAGVIDIRFRRWRLLSDNSWVSLKLDAKPSQAIFDEAVLEPSVAFGTVAVSYELPLGQPFAVDVYLGARWWHVSADAVVETAGPGGPFAGSFTESWADAVVGTRIRYRITDKWRVGAQVDIGGGAASLDWSFFGHVGYDFNRHVGLTAGYRILGVDYSNGGFGYDVRQSGLLLGVRLGY